MKKEFNQKQHIFHKTSDNTLIYESKNFFSEVVYISFIKYDADYSPSKFYLHNHPNYEMAVILNGVCEFELSDHTVLKLKKNQFVLFPPYFKHKIVSESPAFSKLAVQFSFIPKDGNNYYKNAEKQAKKVSVKNASKSMLSIVRRLNEIRTCERMDFHDMLATTFCSLILEAFHLVIDKNDIETAKTYSDKRLSDAISYIEETINAETTVEEVANYIHISKRQLERIFETVLGMSPGMYIKNCRVKKIRNLLMNLDYTLEDVAEIMKYNNVSSVIKTFKRIEGNTPSDFRRSIYKTHKI